MESKLNQNHFVNVEDGTKQAIVKRRSVDPTKICKYYIPFLDYQTGGIASSELIVLGADTGVGKTHLANTIAFKNAESGRKVYLFSLEGEKEEVYQRWLWNIICREYYKKPTGISMNYHNYVLNKIDVKEFEDKALKELSHLKDNLFVYDRKENLNISNFCKYLEWIIDADLIIIDHLHYFDILNPSQEYHEIYQVMKETKMMVEERNIPVILISHLRKKTRDRGIPDNSEFMGSSNIPKIASTCITIASDPENHKRDLGLYSTYFTVTKSRMGADTNLSCLMMFDAQKKTYRKSFELGRNNNGEFTPIEEREYPQWAKKIEF